LTRLAVGQGLDEQPGGLVDDDEGGVLVHDAQEVFQIMHRAIARLGRAGPVDPHPHAEAWSHPKRCLARLGGPAVEKDLAALQPRRGPAPRPGAGAASQPEVEAHVGVGVRDDPLLHLVAPC
jgi:hypothetical protein